jgi:hypothetical protein
VELPAGVGQEPREVPHPLEVSHSHRAPLKHNRPVIALATKAVDVRIRPVFVALDARFGAGGPRSFDPFENRAGRLVLRGGLVCPAAGSKGLGESDTGARRLIGCADLVPEARSLGAEPRPSAASPSARPTLPPASVALATSALLLNRAATSPSSSAAERARSMLPAATSISTCASRRGARCSSVSGGRSLEGTRRGRSSAFRMEVTAVARSPWARRTSARPGWGSQPAS